MYIKCDMKVSQHIVPFCNCFKQHDQCHVVKLVERNMLSEAKHNNPTLTYINLFLWTHIYPFLLYFICNENDITINDLIIFTCDFVRIVNIHTLSLSQEDESCVSSWVCLRHCNCLPVIDSVMLNGWLRHSQLTVHIM